MENELSADTGLDVPISIVRLANATSPLNTPTFKNLTAVFLPFIVFLEVLIYCSYMTRKDKMVFHG